MKIICIGRNYAKHARELGNDLPTRPLFFLKPDSAVLPARHPFVIPEWTNDVHYEVEVILRINRLGKYIQPEFAHRYFAEVGLGIDFTARDIQQECKTKGHPWERAKAFDGSAVISSDFLNLADIGKNVDELDFRLEKNGEVVQQSNTSNMLFHPHDLIAEVSTVMTLKMGDLMFTGTPEGVGAVADGDLLEGYLQDQKMFSVTVR